jgi:predicted permease
MGANDRHPGALLRAASGVVMHMRQIRGWLARLFGMFHRTRREHEFTEELESHLALHIEDNLRAGMSPEEARRVALVKLGGVTQVQELHREQRGLPMLETLLQDLRYGARMLFKNPGFTLIAALTLALGIGATTAIFSLLDTVLLRPLPFRDPERLVMLWEGAAHTGNHRNPLAPANYADWKAQNQSFEDVAALEYTSYNLTGSGEPERVQAQKVTANFFWLLGVTPILGRNFLPEEDRPDGHKVALLSYGYWQRKFGGDAAVIGKEILLDEQQYMIVGVMPVGFQFLSKEMSLWTPKAFTSKELATRTESYLTVVARLKPGVTLTQAQADSTAIAQRINREHPLPNYELTASLIPLREQLTGDVRLVLLVLMVAVGFVLLIACANIANLMLARGVARNKEIAIRSALGASRGRIVRQLLAESVLLSFIGGGAGLVLAWFSFSFLKQMVPSIIALQANLQIDLKVLGFAALLSIFAGVIFGLAPALQGAKVDLNETLKQSNNRAGSHTTQRRLRNALVVTEIALALMLLVGAGLLIKTFLKLRALDLGLRPENVLTLRTELSPKKYIELPKRAAFYQQALERVRAIPGIAAAGYVTAAPLVQKWGSSSFTAEGREPVPGQNALSRQVSPGYMETIGMTLRQGRFFAERDDEQAPPVAIINETMTRQYWPGENALNKRFKIGGVTSYKPWVTVVGIVADVKELGLDVPAKATMFFPYQQMADNFWNTPRELAIRVQGDPANVIAAVRQAIWSVDRDQPISNIRMMNEILAEEMTERRVEMSLLAAFAALGLLMAALGVYGVLSYIVTQHTPELGIRVALGAQPADVLRLVLRQGMRLAVAGIGLGVVAALLVTRLIKTLLFDVSANDPATFAGVALLLALIAMLACWIPAQRAAKVDPLIALRHE